MRLERPRLISSPRSAGGVVGLRDRRVIGDSLGDGVLSDALQSDFIHHIPLSLDMSLVALRT